LSSSSCSPLSSPESSGSPPIALGARATGDGGGASLVASGAGRITIIQLRLLFWILLNIDLLLYLLGVLFNFGLWLYLYGILFNFNLWFMMES
jgi:hypothetical protein